MNHLTLTHYGIALVIQRSYDCEYSAATAATSITILLRWRSSDPAVTSCTTTVERSHRQGWSCRKAERRGEEMGVPSDDVVVIQAPEMAGKPSVITISCPDKTGLGCVDLPIW
ncbi:hypothetical protein OPV22_032424 [Ensete ventricosum]|uniref:ACT domain-containing protein n=1 Tax=Ensete ventricosum TaxID=4639 RepID=A0AAV8PY83_ENSVE|nr:hypothetical protein OPV22_032424 [Ensete ventricosum]